MREQVRLPREGSTTMSSGVVLEWFVRLGDEVVEGQALATIDTDKVAFEVEAPVSGTVLQLAADTGEEIDVGGLLAIIGDADEELPSGRAAAEQPPSEPPRSSAPPSPPSHTPVDRSSPARSDPGTTGRGSSTHPSRVAAAPAARRRARELRVELPALVGTGPGGRITVEDVEQASRTTDRPSTGSDLLSGLHGHRLAVAERMSQAATEIAPVTLHTHVDVTSVLEAQAFLPGTLSDIVAHAAAVAVRVEPGVNASLCSDGITQHEHVGLAYAVDGAHGLVAPVVREAERLDLATFASERRRLVQAAVDGSLRGDDLDGATLTVTNLGPFDVEMFTPIVTPGQCVALGVGAVRSTVSATSRGFRERQILGLSLTFDHRLIDGAPAARYLQEVSARLRGERPA